MEYFKYKNNFQPEKGSLLISEPFLPDPNFERTVVLLCEHNEEGSFGFVLNKPSTVLLDEIMEDVNDFSEKVYIGGPVQQDTLHFVHREENIEGGVPIAEGLYWGGNFEQLLSMINTKQVSGNDFRFFVGYSGWSEGQLKNELDADSWIVANYANEQLVFNTPEDELWKVVLKELGGRFNVYSNYPTDPRLN
ncbi:YqgE/AlgH family protein [Fulvivirga maritima]|uniref:YqgE/AlgH family protein n=1 Tax=Fulvivirga maritima TaxID=2904247 RepID=UPI001F16C463|nr:YqgE/AlgH family protein [Fulvivirga maritima]UII25623.1 YqgE/AlgH family protein [Fulvivirga maritima]